MGVAAAADELLTSGMAAARLFAPGSSALVLGGPGVRDALTDRGVVVRDPGEPVDAVVAGWHKDFDFESLSAGMRAIVAGARFVATNDDPSYPGEDGVLPGAGAIVAFLATASGQRAEVAGKPNPPMVQLVREHLGDALAGSLLVGDRASTDGGIARALGIRFALVRTGIDPAADGGDVTPDVVADDLASLVAVYA
jgi:4-nitrophenyl phosphatase